jgi:carbon monoxide dehydrogenase subunit G
MIEVKHSIIIKRPVAEVFAYISNPDNAPGWITGVQSSSLDEGHSELASGATGKQVRSFLGQTLETTWRILEFKKNESITAEVTSGPLKGFQVAEATAVLPGEDVEHTVVTFSCKGPSAGLRRSVKMAEPIIGRMYSHQLRADVENLRDVLEHGGP